MKVGGGGLKKMDGVGGDDGWQKWVKCEQNINEGGLII